MPVWFDCYQCGAPLQGPSETTVRCPHCRTDQRTPKWDDTRLSPWVKRAVAKNLPARDYTGRILVG